MDTLAALDLERLTGCGAKVRGLDVRTADDATVEAIRRAVFDHGVVFFEGQTLTPDDQIAFARRLGPIVINRFFPKTERWPEIAKVEKTETQTSNIGGGWHTDHSYDLAPAMGSVLLAVQTPPTGGDTLFADMYAAYEDLPDAMKGRIDDLVVLHHYGNRDDLDERSRTAASRLSEEQKAKVSWVRHKLVRTHYGTGRKALYAVSGSSFEIEGMPRDEGVALLDELKRHTLQDKYVFSYAYDVGDVVLWDDLATLHSATLTDPNDPRTLWRITVKEPAPAAA